MPYLGNAPAEAYTSTVKNSFNGDGSTTAFTLSQPSTANNLRVVVENVIQDPTVAYTVSGTTLTFTSAPPVGTDNIYAVHLGPATMTAVPPSEINNATTYTSDLTVQGSFTSQGIDDNADATAITIDSSENVLVGKTSASTSVAGIGLFDGGLGTFTRASAQPLDLNRQTDDGDIILFRKDGTSVGSIGADDGDAYIGTSDTAFIFSDGNDAIIPFSTTAGTFRGSAIDLGYSTYPFKDLYLSGGVYLGGTGSSNLLQDYEEGSWTPGIAGTTSGVKTMGSNNLGRYTKIGQQVTVTATIEVSGTQTISGLVMITGLPFVSRNVSQLRHAAAIGGQILCNLNGASKRLAATLDHNQSSVWLMEQDDDAATYSHTPPVGNSGAIYGFTLSYITDS